MMTTEQLTLLPTSTRPTRSSRRKTNPAQTALREALAPYIDSRALAHLVASGTSSVEDLRQALRTNEAPAEITAMLAVVAAILRPDHRVQIKSPADAAAILMVEMAAYDQEHFVVLSLDTKNRVQALDTLYRGTLNSANIRIAEVFKPAIRRNAAGILVAHNHPSNEPSPSPEDILVTRQIVEAGKLLDIEVIDSLVIGGGQYVSLRQRGLGFPS